MLAPQNVFKSGKLSSWSKPIVKQSLDAVRNDLEEGLKTLDRILNISTATQDLPVAFATNALYVLERNGATDRSYYETILLPILRKKADYLHAEGVAQAVWALSNAEIYDKEIWGQLGRLVREKNFNYTIVKNERWSAS